MNIIGKIVDVMKKNWGYTLVLVASIVLFAVFSKGLLPGLIAAASALIAYICIDKLYTEYRKPIHDKK
ncbi:MAG: hypothetical protein LBF28_02210 [Rickettsiales bacterium]|jgi:hypothetical protein|nr:hypothetical protein [Rickettsiales bacterium]